MKSKEIAVPSLTFVRGAVDSGVPGRSWSSLFFVAGFPWVMCPVVGAAGACGVSGVEDVE